MSLETAEEFHARVAAATDAEGRLPVAIEAMPGWDIFPFELDGLRIKPLEPLQDAEPPREGEDPADCFCQQPMPPERAARVAWRNERWLLVALDMKLPVSLILRPVAALRHRRPAGRHGCRDGRADGAGHGRGRGAAERRALPRRPLRRRRSARPPVLLRPAGPDGAAARLVPARLGGEPPRRSPRTYASPTPATSGAGSSSASAARVRPGRPDAGSSGTPPPHVRQGGTVQAVARAASQSRRQSRTSWP